MSNIVIKTNTWFKWDAAENTEFNPELEGCVDEYSLVTKDKDTIKGYSFRKNGVYLRNTPLEDILSTILFSSKEVGCAKVPIEVIESYEKEVL
jgi:hypothetical protein